MLLSGRRVDEVAMPSTKGFVCKREGTTIYNHQTFVLCVILCSLYFAVVFFVRLSCKRSLYCTFSLVLNLFCIAGNSYRACCVFVIIITCDIMYSDSVRV